jgi:hypothetical protein
MRVSGIGLLRWKKRKCMARRRKRGLVTPLFFLCCHVYESSYPGLLRVFSIAEEARRSVKGVSDSVIQAKYIDLVSHLIVNIKYRRSYNSDFDAVSRDEACGT